jgi:hypothetical protein
MAKQPVLGRDEFALHLNIFRVNITVPADHWLDDFGTLQNMKDVYTSEEMKRGRNKKVMMHQWLYAHSQRLKT